MSGRPETCPRTDASITTPAHSDTNLSVSGARRWLGFILLTGGLIRWVLWSRSAELALPIWDERDYNTLAVNLVRYGQFAFDPGMPISLRPPLYPGVVATIYALFGLENHQAVRLFQAGLSLLTVIVLYRLSAALYGRRAGILAAGLVAFYPSLLAYNNLLLTEVQFTFLLVAACTTLVPALRRGSFALIGGTGLLLGVAALTRSVLWLFPTVLSSFLLAAWPGDFRRRLLAVGTLVGAFALTVAPWTIRNAALEQTFQVVDCMGGRNFMMGNYEYTPIKRSWDAIAIQGEHSWDHMLVSADPASVGVTQGQKDKRALRYGLRFALTHPGLTARRDLVKFFDFWGLERELVAGAARGYFGSVSALGLLLLTLVIFGSYAAAMIAGVFGAIVAPPEDRRAHWALLLVIGFICGMHTITFGHSRYHLPLMPLVLLYSSGAIGHARAIWGQRRAWSFLLACALSTILILSWLWEITVVDPGRFLDALQSTA